MTAEWVGKPDDAPPATAERACRIDYATLSMERRHLAAVLGWAESRFGSPQSGKGLFRLRASQRFTDGRCVVAYDPPGEEAAEHIVLSITGSGCKHLGDEELILSIDEMRKQAGAHMTRLDIAVDHLNSSFPLTIYDLRTKCKHSGELCGAKVGDYREKFSTGKGASRGETLNIGTRGRDGSGRSVCVYDKGLESGTESTPGVWVRWETRFADTCAEKAIEAYSVAQTICEKMNIAYDAVEFREVTGRTERTRRPLSKWWVDLKGGVSDSNVIRRTRKDSDAAKLLNWLDKGVAPILHHIKKETGLEWSDIFSLMGIGKDKQTYKPKQHVVELIEEMQSGACDDEGNELPSIYSMLFEQTVEEASNAG